MKSQEVENKVKDLNEKIDSKIKELQSALKYIRKSKKENGWGDVGSLSNICINLDEIIEFANSYKSYK